MAVWDTVALVLSGLSIGMSLTNLIWYCVMMHEINIRMRDVNERMEELLHPRVYGYYRRDDETCDSDD